MKTLASKVNPFRTMVNWLFVTLPKIVTMVAFTTKKVRFPGTKSSTEVPLNWATMIPHTTYAVVLPNPELTVATIWSRRYS